MENIIEWADKFDKNVRNKPNKQLQEELFSRIVNAINDGSNSVDECVSAFCRFDAKIVSAFYRQVYFDLPVEKKVLWDEAFIKWAEQQGTGKNERIRAIIRLVPIIQEKLMDKTTPIDGVIPELRWLALHEEERSFSAYKVMREQLREMDLRKLLALDITSWSTGKAHIEKMYGLLFADSFEQKTKEAYSEFLSRNGFGEKTTSYDAKSISTDTVVKLVEVSGGNESVTSKEKTETAPSEVTEMNPTYDEPALEKEPMRQPVVKKTDISHDGVALAEALLKWTQEYKERSSLQMDQIVQLKAEINRVNSEIEELRAYRISSEQIISDMHCERSLLTARIAGLEEKIVSLTTERDKALETIARIQQMSGNSVKQEMDGFKHSLAGELKKTVEDFSSDMSDIPDGQKADVYKALLEEMLDTLNHNGIAIGDK